MQVIAREISNHGTCSAYPLMKTEALPATCADSAGEDKRRTQGCFRLQEIKPPYDVISGMLDRDVGDLGHTQASNALDSVNMQCVIIFSP